MKSYKHLTEEERYLIYSYLKGKKSLSFIASELGVNKSTISREVMRNSGLKGYRPLQAQGLSDTRKCFATKALKLTPEMKSAITKGLQSKWSPEQISNRLKLDGKPSISHESIYQFVYKDKVQGGDLYTNLRQSSKKKKKRYGTYDKRGQIKDRVSIDKRPAIVDKKTRKGDWEIDTVVGKNHKGFLVTIVERKSSFTVCKYVNNKTANEVSCATIDALKKYKDQVHTITADNGKEFAYHKKIAKSLKASVYFAHPYHSWERGLNENTNGLLRQYFKKGESFENITDSMVNKAVEELNDRPRKKLGYKTPNEIFLGKRRIRI